VGLITKITILIFAFAALYGFARYWGLGRSVGILHPAQARQIAFDTLYGFAAEETVIDRGGQSALLKGHCGNYAIIQRHGAHFIAREFSAPVLCDNINNRLTLRSDIFPKGYISINLGPDGAVWLTRLSQNL
jgi:hypothetical protein